MLYGRKNKMHKNINTLGETELDAAKTLYVS
jgi:hypothetical protein